MWALGACALSVSLTTLGVVVLASRDLPDERGSHPLRAPSSFLGLSGQGKPTAKGLLGSALYFGGAVLGLVPTAIAAAGPGVAGNEAEDLAKWPLPPALLLCVTPLLCLLVRVVFNGETPPSTLTAGAFAAWLGASLIEWGSPRPLSGLGSDLADLSASGRDGGYRGPFLVYLLGTGALLAGGHWAMQPARPTDFPPDFPPPLAPSSKGVARMLFLPVACGALSPLAELCLAYGAAALPGISSVVALLVGGVLMVFVVRTAWDCLHRAQLPMLCFVTLSRCYAVGFRLVQLHVLFHDLSWSPTGSSLLWLGSPNIVLFAMGIVIVCFGALAGLTETASALAVEHHYYAQVLRVPSDATPSDLLPPPGPFPWSPRRRQAETAATGGGISRQWVALLLCAVCYYLGITQPLVTVKPPPMNVGTEAHGHSKSNLELIGYLYGKGMPVAALMILICSLVIPATKFAVSGVLLLRTSAVPANVYSSLAHTLTFLSPYQFIDAFVVLLLLAYLNMGGHGHDHGGNQGFSAKIAHGFWFFLSYCLASVILAQVLESDYEPLPMPEDDCPKLQLPTGGRRGRQQPPDDSKLSHAERPPYAREYDRGASPDLPLAQGMPAEFQAQLLTMTAHLGVWFVSWCILVGNWPPLVIQFRVANLVVFVKDPDVSALHSSLLDQSKLLTYGVIVVLLVTPVLYTISVFVRALLISGGGDGGSTRKFWLWEQLLRPWVMGDVVAVGMSVFFLSVQEPDANFIRLVARLPVPPVGLFAFVLMGTAAWGLRSVSPPLHPANEEPTPAGLLSGRGQTPQYAREQPAGISKKVGWGLLQHYGAGLFWFLLIYQFGPKPPPLVSSYRDINAHVAKVLPMANQALHAKLPPAVGRCDLLEEKNATIAHRGMGCQGDHDLTDLTLHIGAMTLDAHVEWIEGLDTLTLTNITVLPQASGEGSDESWALYIGGYFSALNVWVKALHGDTVFSDKYRCCPNPYHFVIEAVADCTEDEGFHGDIRVSHIQCDDVEMTTDFMPGRDFVGFKITVIDRDLLKDRLGKQIERMMNGQAAHTASGHEIHGAPIAPFRITKILNHLVRLNTPNNCPSM